MLYLLLAANVGVFAIMAVITGQLEWSAQTLLEWGGDYGPLSLHGEPWRLVTSQYLHENLIHIFSNMVLLWITGRFLGDKLSPAWFMGSYTLCGIVAAVTSASLNYNVVGIGASGAIAGLLGILVVFWATGRYPEIRGSWVVQTVGINALYSAYASHVDWAAHLGGFVCGLLCGGLLLAFVVRRPVPDMRAS